MSHSVQEKQGKRILLVTASDPFDFRVEQTQLMDELHALLGEVKDTTYIIYDVRHLDLNFGSIVSGVSGFTRPQTEFDKQLGQHARMLLVGSSTLITVAAKTVARILPNKPTLIFDTPEEAFTYAQAELAK